eukprot:1357012-Pyramimonas_sp.AAC.1
MGDAARREANLLVGDTSPEEVRWATYEAIQVAQRGGQPGAQEAAVQTLSAQFLQAVRPTKDKNNKHHPPTPIA